ncbi:MAG TPA: ABC transporter substrate-binding protein [Acidimicrobiales bacterium]|nr:ABC transporter substrate-binding protein [Acidimicrobiales bacterium]
MRTQDSSSDDEAVGRGLTRRQLLKAMGAGGAVLAAAPVLAACGSSSPSSSSSTTTSGGGSSSSSVSDITKFITVDSAHSGKGLTLDVGVVLALSGPGSFYGQVMSKGTDLAVRHIQQLGGPTFHPIYKDHKSGDAQAGASAVKELGLANVGLCMASYVDDLGAMFAGTAQYKMLTLDGGGGTSSFGQGKPYFWGTRAITPDDTFGGVIHYIKNHMSSVKRISIVGWDLGALDDPIIANLKKALSAAGLQFGIFEPVAVGATDYSTAIQHIKSDNPDLLFLSIYGLDPGVFMKQYVTSGFNKQVIGFEFTNDAAKTAGSAYDKYWFAYDYFDAKNPPNGWAKIFVDEYKAANGGTEPDFYAANFYENTFKFWELVQRTLKAGGDPKSGTDMQTQLEANTTFKSVYGGDANTAGTTTLDPNTHTVTSRPMGLFNYNGGDIKSLAFFNLNGTDYKEV